MIKVLFIAYYFPPMGGAGTQRSQKFVQFLPSEGFLPVVVAGPASSEGRWTPHDATLMAAIPSNVSVYRVEGPVPESAGKLRRRLETWLGLPGTFSRWWIRSATEVASTVAGNTGLIFATMPPFASVEVAHAISRRSGIPWVADFRDPWALDEIQMYPTSLHRKLDMVRMEKLLASAAVIVMNTPEATAALKTAFPRLHNRKIATIPNGFDEEGFADDVTPRTDLKFRIVHAGYFLTDTGLQLRKRRFYRLLGGVQSGVDVLTRSPVMFLEAIERWCAEQPGISKDLEIVFAGKTSEEDRALVSNSKVSSLIRFTGYISHIESLRLIRTADLLFLPMHNLATGRRSTTAPSKTYEYMASGRPILAAVPDGDARDFLTQCGTGLVCRPDDVSGMVRILDRVYGAWKKGESLVSPNKNFISQFERRNLTRALAKAFNGLLAREEPRNPAAHDAQVTPNSKLSR